MHYFTSSKAYHTLVQKLASYKTQYSQRKVDSDVYIWMISDDSYRKFDEIDKPKERVYKSVSVCFGVFFRFFYFLFFLFLDYHFIFFYLTFIYLFIYLFIWGRGWEDILFGLVLSICSLSYIF